MVALSEYSLFFFPFFFSITRLKLYYQDFIKKLREVYNLFYVILVVNHNLFFNNKFGRSRHVLTMWFNVSI